MTEPELPPLDDDVAQLVERARALPRASNALKARVLAGVEASVASGPGGGGSSGGASDAGATPGAASVANPTAVRRLGPLAVSFILGGGLVALYLHPAARRAPSTASSATVWTRPSSSALPPSVAGPASLPPPPLTSAPSRHEPEARVSTSALDALTAERRLLDAARGALEQGDPASALRAVHQHERLYPSGALVQERESMAIRALLSLGRRAAARARAQRFQARFPHSSLWPAIEASLQSPTSSPGSAQAGE